jgi:hypothetical protein
MNQQIKNKIVGYAKKLKLMISSTVNSIATIRNMHQEE